MTADQVAEIVFKRLIFDPKCAAKMDPVIRAAIEEALAPMRKRDATKHMIDGKEVQVQPYNFNAAGVLSILREARRRLR